MADTNVLRFFPQTHIIAIAVAVLLLLIALVWPSGSNKQVQTHLTISISQTGNQPDNEQYQPDVLWKADKVRSGDSLSTLFDRNDLSAVDVIQVAAAAPRDALTIRPGQTIRWVPGQGKHINQLELQISPLAKHHFQRNAAGELEYKLIERNADYVPQFAATDINNSLFLDGDRAGVPEQVLIELAGIFGWDIDFALDIRPGDAMALIYEEIYLDGERIGYGDILIARFVNQGKTYTAVRYEGKDGTANYYTPEGLSMRKEFLRNPIDFARISSRFNLRRRHPVLNTIRAHRGTDYAAATGTPIKAAGDGKVIFAGRKGGYGNVVIIQHGTRYQTLYAHLSRFGRGIRRGKSVRQSQIIGYVGKTGLATGPHLHYEFRVDGVHRDSLRVKLPKAKSISSAQKADFTEQAEAMVNWLDNLATTSS